MDFILISYQEGTVNIQLMSPAHRMEWQCYLGAQKLRSICHLFPQISQSILIAWQDSRSDAPQKFVYKALSHQG